MTYRDRRLARAEQLRGQAGRNEVKADAALARADGIGSLIPMGQPILVGHHSERRHRRDLARIDWPGSSVTAGRHFAFADAVPIAISRGCTRRAPAGTTAARVAPGSASQA